MSFSTDFRACMSPLPTPDGLLQTLGDVLEFIERLHNAIEASGGDVEVTLGAVAALGAAAGIDEAVLGVAAEAAQVTVMAYIGACAGCAVKVGGIQAVRALLVTAPSGFGADTLVAAADAQEQNAVA
jgi:hypothetical protein